MIWVEITNHSDLRLCLGGSLQYCRHYGDRSFMSQRLATKRGVGVFGLFSGGRNMFCLTWGEALWYVVVQSIRCRRCLWFEKPCQATQRYREIADMLESPGQRTYNQRIPETMVECSTLKIYSVDAGHYEKLCWNWKWSRPHLLDLKLAGFQNILGCDDLKARDGNGKYIYEIQIWDELRKNTKKYTINYI